jgi:tetratricopeptide (TPR) repeat protein
VYAALGETYIYKAGFGYASRKEILPIAYSLASKALSIDSTSWTAYSVLGSAKSYEFKWIQAEKLYREAIAINPNQSKPHSFLGYLLTTLGRHDEAIKEAKIAQKINPLSVWHNTQVGRLYYYARRYDEAITEFDKILDLNPDAIFPQFVKAMALTQKERYNEAIDLFLQRKVKSPETNWALGYTYGVAGYKDKARNVLNFLLEKSKHTYIWPAIIAYVYIGLGDKDNAMYWLEKTYHEREAWLEFLKVDPWFDSLRSDTRFQHLIERMNYPE